MKGRIRERSAGRWAINLEQRDAAKRGAQPAVAMGRSTNATRTLP